MQNYLPVSTIFEFSMEHQFGHGGLRLQLLGQMGRHFMGEGENQVRAHSLYHQVL